MFNVQSSEIVSAFQNHYLLDCMLGLLILTGFIIAGCALTFAQKQGILLKKGLGD